MSPQDRQRYLLRARQPEHLHRVVGARSILHRAAALGRFCVSMSWGKDSTVLGHLALDEIGGAVDMLHLAVAHELPDGEAVQNYFETRATVHVLPPLSTIAESLEWLRDVGLPHERDRAAHARIIQTRKKDRAIAWYQEHGFAVTVLGMRGEESIARRHLFSTRGPIYQLAKGQWIANPLYDWSGADVWAYLVEHELPWHPLYDYEWGGQTRERLRNGGWLYTDGAPRGWCAWLRRHYREQWEQLVAEFPRMKELS